MHALSRHPVRWHGVRRAPAAETSLAAGPPPAVVFLGDPRATDPALSGRKAATLASASSLGFPVMPGFVVTTAGCSAIAAAGGLAMLPASIRSVLHDAWSELSDHGRLTIVVRSSSPGEDGATSSMAGQFTSVLGVRDAAGFASALQRVIESAAVGADDALGDVPPMAVLVQLQVYPRWGGVLFGADPVTGRSDRLVLATVEGGPDQLVSGAVDGSRATLSTRGRLLALDGPPGSPRLPLRQRRLLVRLAVRAARAFGGPQDIEWAIDAEAGLLLLQSRPITAVGAVTRAAGPVMGPGPVAETFPAALSPLEADLWLRPLAEALGQAVLLTGAASKRQVASSPVVTSVAGWAAVDLELLGIAPQRRSLLARLDPRPASRRLRAAWRTGRLGAALPGLAADLVARADEELRSVASPATLSDDDLVAVLNGSFQALVSLNAHEVLAGMLGAAPAGDREKGGPGPAATSAGAALHALAAARSDGLDDADIVARHPVVLALVPPAVGSSTPLPDVLVLPVTEDGRAPGGLLAWREELRLRVRWIQELTAVAAAELGERLARRDLIPDPEAVRWLGIEELVDAVLKGVVPDEIEARRLAPAVAPLPAAFRLGQGDLVVPVELAGHDGGQGAGGGRALGRVVHSGSRSPEPGEILVTRTLDPGLAPLLPGLGGLVAETGSVLSHLAILARELGIPTVVGVPDAIARFSPGSVLVVDGRTGDVTAVETTGAA